MAWDVTVRDTYTPSRTQANTVREPGAAANKALASKTQLNTERYLSHTFFPVAVETAGTWGQLSIELIQEIGRRIATASEDTREQRCSCYSGCQ